MEFGAFRGGNALFMARVVKALYPGIKVFAFDTFSGMPKTDSSVDAHSEGSFGNVDLAELRALAAQAGLDNIEFVPGLFEETAHSALERRIGKVALAHFDCGIYSAVKYSYDVVKPFMLPRGYIVFDDATVSSCIGATQAAEELVIRRDGLNSEQIYPHFVFRAP